MRPDTAQIFKALALNTRLKIVQLLKTRGPMVVSNIADELKITNSAVSQHLRILRQAGLVDSSREGFWIPYAINEEAMDDCCRQVNDICSCGCNPKVKIIELKTDEADLDRLQSYKDELRNALKAVESRIDDLKKNES